MAKKEEKKKVVLERSYVIPLRREYLKAPNWKRTPKAVRAIKAFLKRHMKSDDIKIGKYLNDFMWKNGIKNPPHHVKVDARKEEDGIVYAELVGAPKEEALPKKPAKKEESPEKPPAHLTKKEAKEEKLEEKMEEVKEEEQEKAIEIEKEEIKELQKEHPKMHPPKQPSAQKKVEQHQKAPVGRPV